MNNACITLKSIFKYQWKLLKRKLVLVIGVMLLSVIISLLTIYMAYINKDVLDNVFAKLDFNHLIHILPNIIITFLSLIIINIGQTYLNTKLSALYNCEVQYDFFEKLQKMSYRFLSNLGSNDIFYRMFVDSSKVSEFFLSFVLEIPIKVITVAIFFIVMCNWSFELSIFIVSFIIIQLVFVQLFRKPLRRAVEKYREAEQIVASSVAENFKIIESIKLFSLEKYQGKMVKENLMNLYVRRLKTVFIQAICAAICSLISNIWGLGSLIFGAWLATNGKLTIGSYIAVTMLANNMYNPIQEIINYIMKYQEAQISYKRVREYCNQEEPREYSGKLPFTLKESFDVVSVDYEYVEGAPVIKDYTEKFLKGTSYALMGTSGIGKTTLSRLLTRLLFPSHGNILLDGTNIYDISFDDFRKNVAYLPQVPVLFNDTFKNNIVLDKSYTEQEFADAIHACQLENLVTSLPEGIDTKLGVGGINLSEGEKQRLCLARTLIRRPSIVILDEPTSHLDPENKTLIFELIQTHIKKTGALIIVISHDKAITKYVDKVIDFI